MRNKILNGDIIRTAVTLGWPVMLSNIFQTLYDLTDAFWVGKLGSEALAAPSISWPIMFLFISLGAGFGIAGVSLVSQYTGAGQPEKANKAAGQLLISSLIGSCVMAILGFIFTGDVLRLMGASKAVQSTATPYLQIKFLSVPLLFCMFVFTSLLRGYGDTRTPMMLTISSAVLDTVLDPFFVFGLYSLPKMGVAGAAFTDLISRGSAAIIGISLLFSGKVGIKLKLSYLKPNTPWIKKIASIGVPSSIARSGSALGFVALMHLVTIEDKLLSEEGILLAAYGAGSRIMSIVHVMIWGGVTAVSTMVGQNLGANQNERAGEIVKKLLLFFFSATTVGSAAIYFLRVPLYQLFINDPAVLKTGSTFMTFMASAIPFFALFRLSGSVFDGSGHTKPSMVLSLTRLWGLRIPLSYVLYFVFWMGATGIWTGMTIGNFVGAILSVAWLSRGKWKKKVIEESRP